MKVIELIKTTMAIGSLLLLASCQNDDDFTCHGNSVGQSIENLNCDNDIIQTMEKDSAIVKFAEILSLAVYDRQDVREFLKKEASKKFDGNSDILYHEVKNLPVSGATFKDILTSYSSEIEMATIEKSVPYLNIFIPEMQAFDVTLNNLDCTDAEIPIAVAQENGMDLFLNGNNEATIPNGELPAFHSIVVNENGLIKVSTDINGKYLGYELLSSMHAAATTRSAIFSYNEVGSKAVAAYNYFNKDDASKYSRALQRDYIYYGITPSNGNGSLDYNVNEYISYIEVNPKSYFKLSDQKSEDPSIVKNSVSRHSKDYSTEELIKEMWSEGNYSFRFEIISSNQSQPSISIITVSPQDLWDFNLDKHFRHGTWFRKSKYTYTIDPNKFTPKRFDLSSQRISLGKWDLSQEAMERYVSIYEEDATETEVITLTYEMNKMTSTKVNGNIKYGLGTNLPTGDVGAEINNSTTRRTNKTITTTKAKGDDALGTIKIYFYDPIILNKTSEGYEVKSYNTGIVSFGIIAK